MAAGMNTAIEYLGSVYVPKWSYPFEGILRHYLRVVRCDQGQLAGGVALGQQVVFADTSGWPVAEIGVRHSVVVVELRHVERQLYRLAGFERASGREKAS